MTTNLERAAIRKPWLKRLEGHLGCAVEAPSKKRPTEFEARNGSLRVVLRVSPTLHHNELYEFTLDARHIKFLRESRGRSFVAFGCGSAKKLLIIPFRNFARHLDDLYPYKSNGWRVHIYPENGALILRGQDWARFDITKYLVK